ncbi:MAG: NYN domain-containing protein [Candidatus Woesearchaeota archaeon]
MNEKDFKKRIAFIDAYNTANTTEKLLGFVVDWKKLHTYLLEEWNCEKIFFYSGVEIGDNETEKEYELLKSLRCEMRIKTTIPYKRKDKKVSIECAKCGYVNIETISMGYEKKSNCDVELTVDALEEAEKNSHFLIFTGDGDFDYLVRLLVEKNVFVTFVSNMGKNKITPRRFSTKLKILLKENNKVKFIDINTWKLKIQRENV